MTLLTHTYSYYLHSFPFGFMKIIRSFLNQYIVEQQQDESQFFALGTRPRLSPLVGIYCKYQVPKCFILQSSSCNSFIHNPSSYSLILRVLLIYICSIIARKSNLQFFKRFGMSVFWGIELYDLWGLTASDGFLAPIALKSSF